RESTTKGKAPRRPRARWRKLGPPMRRAALVTIAVVLGFSPVAGADREGTFWTSQAKHHPGPVPLADLVERARPAVVHVRGLAEEGSSPGERGEAEGGRMSIGTGFIVNRDGYVVTNEHVVRSVVDLRVRLYDGRELPACVV